LQSFQWETSAHFRTCGKKQQGKWLFCETLQYPVGAHIQNTSLDKTPQHTPFEGISPAGF